ncbi:VOC family protein [Cohnella sp. CFH 77786]|uniref:VOC family protein n=1 Tax=Cohnella sp. CFH 77786 TaxID=2662265 RepID=UPI001C60FB4D|nr:VOC family protein [Cohnella sp. CFH 77786]MBW5449136.1 VOC family protein [Cohnella sp. CFH 77786]
MGKVLRFELQVPDPEQAVAFYSRTFGWQFVKMPGARDYWFIRTGEPGGRGIDGGLMRSPDGETRTANSIEVESIDRFLATVTANGGSIVVPKTTVPGMGYFAYCTDNQGLLFGISESNADA